MEPTIIQGVLRFAGIASDKEVIVGNFEDLEVWKRSCRLAILVYEKLKDCRDYGLKDQMTRAAVSIPSNIAEGAERRTVNEFVSFLYIAKGSAGELRTQIYIANRLGIISSDDTAAMTAELKEISRMLFALIASQNKQQRK